MIRDQEVNDPRREDIHDVSGRVGRMPEDVEMIDRQGIMNRVPFIKEPGMKWQSAGQD